MDKPLWLSAADSPQNLPSARAALAEPNGLLAVGGSLAPEWLLTAYVQGIFPWYEAGQPILWWSPDPRAVLLPDELHVPRRLQRTRRNSAVRISADTEFSAVIAACAAPRRYTAETWITPAMRDAYLTMHTLGWAHSFEAWLDGDLIGGLYGIAIGKVFFGESMFSRRTDSSKIALVSCVEYLRDRGFGLVDCQVWSPHLRTFGAQKMPRDQFLSQLERLCTPAGRPRSWQADYADYACKQAQSEPTAPRRE
jgi:leucyl/phenylalanyl-tRNA--protein transferase